MITFSEKCKSLLRYKKLLRIKGLFLVVLVLFCTSALYYVLSKENVNQAIEILVYLLSSFVLCNLTISTVTIIFKVRKWILTHKHIYNLVYDAEYRMNYSVYLSLGMTIITAICKLSISIFFVSVWFAVVAVYSIVMGVARFIILKNQRKVLRIESDEDRQRYEAYTYKNCGISLIIFTLTLCAAVWQMIFYDKGTSYSGFLIYVIATYTFYSMGIAIKNMIKSRKVKNLILVAIQHLGYVNALVSMLMLQTAMFVSFGGEGLFKRWMNAISGMTVCLIILIMGIQMIRKANRVLKVE